MTKNNNTTICFIGGDERQKYAAINISQYTKVNTVGGVFESITGANINVFDNPLKAIRNAGVIVLPLPAAAAESVLSFDDLVENSADRHILGGKFSPYLKSVMENKKVNYTDYYNDDSFTVKNAFLTAEGAVYLAMSSSKDSIKFSKCAILGYGRIGKALGELLKALYADVTVFARKDEAVTTAVEKGLSSIKISSDRHLSALANNFDIIFNTIPERVISNDVLLALPSKTILIELASLPGGFDPDIATQCEVTFIDGKGLPGKYAPVAAGRILSDTIIQYLKQEELL